MHHKLLHLLTSQSSLKAVPDCSSLEAQMFIAMVDVNNDGSLSLQELQDGLLECREVDAVVSGAAGDAERRKQAEASMAAMVQTMRTKAPQLLAGLQTAEAQRGGYVTFQVRARIDWMLGVAGGGNPVRCLLSFLNCPWL